MELLLRDAQYGASLILLISLNTEGSKMTTIIDPAGIVKPQRVKLQPFKIMVGTVTSGASGVVEVLAIPKF